MILSENFLLEEMTSTTWDNLSKIKQMLMMYMANQILQKIHNKLLNHTMTVTSGERSQLDFNRLVKEGLNPSITSDHNFGNLASLDAVKHADKYKMFGQNYVYGVGAVDIVFTKQNKTKCTLEEVKVIFNTIVNMDVNKEIKIGQVILEYNPSGGKLWIHIANPAWLIYSDSFIKLTGLQKPYNKYMTSMDGGKSYKQYINY